MVKKLLKQTKKLVGFSIVTPIGLRVASGLGASAAAMGGLTTLAGYGGMFGTLVGAGTALRLTRGLRPKKKRRR